MLEPSKFNRLSEFIQRGRVKVWTLIEAYEIAGSRPAGSGNISRHIIRGRTNRSLDVRKLGVEIRRELSGVCDELQEANYS